MTGDVFDVQQRGMAAGDDKRQRVFRERAELQLGDGDVADDVVDAVDRLVGGPRQGLGPGNAYGKAAGQAGTRRNRDGVDIGKLHIRVGQCL